MTEQERIDALRAVSEDLTDVIEAAEEADAYPTTISDLLRGKDAIAREILLRERAQTEAERSR